jgi:DNA-binding CsgD family transcriptional regulator
MAPPSAGPHVSHHGTAFVEPFTARPDHLELLWNQYQRARAGHANVVVVIGEPGIGKTHLLTRLATRAAQEGATILEGHASETEAMPPYLPFLEALGAYVRAAPLDQLREQTSFAPESLASILPELATRLGVLPASHPLPPERQRLRLYEAVGSFLEAISLARPVLLLLDDLHLADAESLSLLCYVVRHHPNARLLILGASREGKHQEHLAFIRAMTELTRHRVLTTLKVPRRALLEVESLAQSYLGGSVSPAVAVLLSVQSEGNPFFVEELLRGWVESGALLQEGGQWSLAAPVDNLPLPSGVSNTLRQLLAQLCPETIEHLRVAAIIGRTFSAALLAAVEEQEVETVEECLQDAARACLVVSDGADHVCFSQRAMHEYLYQQMTTSRRQRIHGRIAQALAARLDEEQPGHSTQLAELAHHVALSGDRARGIESSQRAVAAALRAYIAQTFDALIQMPLQGMAAEEASADAPLPGAGRSLGLRNRGEEAQPHSGAWLALVGNLQLAARSAQKLGLAEWSREALRAAQAALDYALALVEQRPSPEGMQRLADLVASFVSHSGYQPAGQGYAQRLLALAHRLTDAQTAPLTYAVSSKSAFGWSRLDTAHLRAWERVLALIESSAYPEGTDRCWFYLAGAHYWRAEILRSYEVVLRWAAYAERSQPPRQVWAARAWLAWLHASRGAFAEAEQALEQAQSLMAADSEPPELLHYIHSLLAFQREEYPATEQALQALLVNAHTREEHALWCAPLLMLTFLGMGKQNEAHRYREQLRALLTRLPPGTLPTLPILLALALAALAQREQAEARTLYHGLLAFEGQCCWFLVDRVLGAIATCSGDGDAAAAHFARAEETARREGLLPELARTLLGRADLEQARGKEGKAAQAHACMREALALFEQLSMRQAAHEIRSRPGPFTHQPEKLKISPLPAGLTGRELDVLRLVAEGKRNDQIAGELHLSEKTVANHLTIIFQKTASKNRAAAAAFAIRQGLV